MKGVNTLQLDSFTWLNVDRPTEQILKKLQKQHNFHHLAIEDCISHNQRPKIDEYEDHLFIVVHLPKQVNDEIVIDEADIFISQDFVMMVHEGNPFLNELFQTCVQSDEKRAEFAGKGSGYLLYKLIDEIFTNLFRLVEERLAEADTLEDRMFEKTGQEDMLGDILWLRKDIITLRRILGPQRTVIPQLEHKNTKFLPEKLEVYFDDVVDIVERTWSHLESLNSLGESLARTNESLISHNINNVIKVLTIFSVVMLPLTFVTSLYGMNVQLPLAEHSGVFNILAGVMVGMAVLMFAFFKYKKWL